MKQFKSNILILFLSELLWNKGKNCCFTDSIKKLQCWHGFRRLWISSVQTCYDKRYYWILHFDISLTDLDSRSKESKKAKAAPVISQTIQSNWMEFGILLRCVRVINLMLILSHSFNTQGKEPYLCDFFKENVNLGLCSDIYRPIFFKLGTIIETTKFYILISVWMTLTFIQGHSCMRNQKLLCPFSWKHCRWFGLDSVFATNCWFVKAHAKFVCTSNIFGRELCRCDFIEYMFNIVLFGDTHEQICFKHCLMLNIAKIYTLISVWLTLMFTQSYRVYRKTGTCAVILL